MVETVSFPIAEWAAGASAIDLVNAVTRSSDPPDDVRTDLDHAVFFGGNNGWTGSHEKQDARTYVSNHVRSTRVDPEQAASYVLAQGVSDKEASVCGNHNLKGTLFCGACGSRLQLDLPTLNRHQDRIRAGLADIDRRHHRRKHPCQAFAFV